MAWFTNTSSHNIWNIDDQVDNYTEPKTVAIQHTVIVVVVVVVLVVVAMAIIVFTNVVIAIPIAVASS